MQKGISVEMAAANNARAWPQADDNDAWVVTVDNGGRLYFGTNAMTLKALRQWMVQHPRRRDQKLFIKADARVPYASVEKALDAADGAEFAEPVLLVNQRGSTAGPGVIASPEGLEVSIGSATPSFATVVQLLPSGERASVRVNNDEVPSSTLDDTLRRHFEKGDDKVVLLRASAELPFAEVVHAIDNCRAAGARVYLAGSEL